MLTTVAAAQPLGPWLKRRARIVTLRQDLMSALYDLDGAAAQQQQGLMTWSLRGVVAIATTLHLVEAGVEVPDFDDREEEWLPGLERLQTLQPALAKRALWLRECDLRSTSSASACADLFAFLTDLFGLDETFSLRSSVARWAQEAADVQNDLAHLGMARESAWYVSGSDESWHSHVLKQLEGDYDGEQ